MEMNPKMKNTTIKSTIDKEEIEDLVNEAREDSNPNQQVEEVQEHEQEEVDDDEMARVSEEDTKAELQGSELRRSTRTSQPVSRLKPTMSGQSYLQNGTKKKKRNVRFAEDELRQMEYCHNLISQVKPDDSQNMEYGTSHAMVIARLIQDITMKVMAHGASFGQQFILQKGLNIFGKRGHEASKKEIDQLHRRTCFALLNVKDMSTSERKKAQLALMFLTEKRDKNVKGRMVYNLAKELRDTATIRTGGGPNCGHTVRYGDKTHICSSIPANFLKSQSGFLGPKVLVSPEMFFNEYQIIEKTFGISPEVGIDEECPIITPFDVFVNQQNSATLGGTTGKGIHNTQKRTDAGVSFKFRDLYGTDFHIFQILESIKKYYNITENFIRLSFGLSLSDIWFIPRKYD